MAKQIYLPLLLGILTFLSFGSKAQNALNFDGNNDYVQTNYSGILGSSNRSFEAWVFVNSGHTANVAIVDYGTNAVGSRNTFVVGGDNSLRFISGGINANIGSSANAVPTNQWVHVAFVLNSTTGYLYVNGSQVGTGNLSTVNTPSSSITNLRIGQRVPGGSIPFDGSIDEVRIWNYARSTSEINADMNAEICVFDNRLVAYHKFNHGTAGGSNSGVTTSVDNSINSNSGTLTNFSLSGSSSNWVSGRTLSTAIQFGNDTITSCHSYSGPSGTKNWTTSGNYSDTISSMMGCDSVVTINLTVLDTSHSYISVNRCASYTSPSRNHTWFTSGNYADTLMNSNSCDSIVFIDLSINNSSAFVPILACSSYTSPSGRYTWTSTGVYQDTIPNNLGCDSIMTIGLTIQNNSSTVNVSDCFSYNSPSGKYVWTMDGTYFDTVPNSHGCDSVIRFNIDITGPSSASLNIDRCDQFTSPSGNYTWNQTGTYMDTIPNAAGCDSVLTINLQIGRTSSSESVAACDTFIIPGSGQIVTSNGFYTDTLQTSGGCDSVVSYQVTISNLNDSVIRTGNTFQALQIGGAYDWFLCNNGVLDSLVQDSGSLFTASMNGSYLVVISQGSCIDTSDCFDVTGIHVNERNSSAAGFKVFPNPSSGTVHVSSKVKHEQIIELISISGQKLDQFKIEQNQVFEVKLPPGMYFIRSNSIQSRVYPLIVY